MKKELIHLPAGYIRELGVRIFTALGAPVPKAELVVETLVEASLTGHDSHGVIYFLRYAERIRKGFIRPDAEPIIVRETPSSALLDGCWGFGQVTAMRAMELAAEKALRGVVSAVGAYNCNHIGRVGYYTSWAARRGLIGLMFVNVGHPMVSVYGGVGRVLGTNPFSASAPTGDDPFLLDYATSTVADGKVSWAIACGMRIPSHWIRDKNGRPTEDPNELREGGWLQPFGGHKGYCLQLLMELMGAALTGSRSGVDPEIGPPSTNGILAIAINPEGFVGLEAFMRRSQEILRMIKESKAEDGGEILIPGDPEWETRRRRLKEGIPIPESFWNQILKLKDELSINL